MSYVVGSAEVELVPTAEGFDAKANALLKDLSVKVRLDPDIAGLRAKIAEIRNESVNVKVDLHDRLAKTELDVLTRPRLAPIVATPVGGGAEGKAADAAGGGGDFRLPMPPISPLIGTLGLLATALVPIAASATAGTLALASMFTLAGGGVLVFAALVVGALKLDKAFSKDLAPGLKSLKSVFDSLVKSNLGAILKPLSEGIRILVGMMPAFTPVIRAVSGALVSMLKPIDAYVKSGAFAKLGAQMAPLVGGAIVGFGKVMGNLLGGVGSIGKTLLPLGERALAWLVKFTGQFALLGKSTGFRNFIAYAVKEMPLVGSVIGGLLVLIGHLLVGLAPVGAAVLGILNPIVAWLNKLPIGLLTQLVTGIALVVAAMVVWGIVAGVVNAIMDANPISLIILGVALLTAGIVWLVVNWKSVVAFLRNAWQGAVTWLRGTLVQIGEWWVGTWTHVREFFTVVWAIIPGFFRTVWTATVSWFGDTTRKITRFFADLPGNVLKALSNAGQWLWNVGVNMIRGLINGAGSLLVGLGRWLLSKLPGWLVTPFEAALGIHSPSTVMAGIGENMGKGLQIGLTRSLDAAVDAGVTKLRSRTSELSVSAVSAATAQVHAQVTAGRDTSRDESLNLLRKIAEAVGITADKTATAADIARATKLQARTGGTIA